MNRRTNHDEASQRSETSGKGLVLAVPRSRGAISGIVLLALGVWGFLVPVLGPHFTFGYGPAKTFDFTAARLWLQILPGVVVAVAGLAILVGGNRLTGTVWAYLAIAGGVWFVIGPVLADLRTKGYVGAPMGGNTRQHLSSLLIFSGLGAAIILFAALIAGRLSVVGVRDVCTRDKRHGANHNEVASDEVATRDEVNEMPDHPTREVPVTTSRVRPVHGEIGTPVGADTTAPDHGALHAERGSVDADTGPGARRDGELDGA